MRGFRIQRHNGQFVTFDLYFGMFLGMILGMTFGLFVHQGPVYKEGYIDGRNNTGAYELTTNLDSSRSWIKSD